MMYFTEENGEIKVITGDLFDQKETRILVRDIFKSLYFQKLYINL